MLKKYLVILLSISIAHAETCPSPEEIHQYHLHGWEAFDIDNGTPLSRERLNVYTQSVQQFALAEWADESPEGPGHCYYYGTQPSHTYLYAYLAKQNIIADKSSTAWKPLGSGTMQCHTGINECGFVEK
jgi:hypothetical protein